MAVFHQRGALAMIGFLMLVAPLALILFLFALCVIHIVEDVRERIAIKRGKFLWLEG